MNLREMEVFRAVMLCGTVKGAGELLHISQPAASKLIAQAERRSGLRLFERVKGRLIPTPEAHQLYPEIEAVWKSMERARSVSRERAAPRGGRLRVVATARFCTFLLPTAITQLFETYPELSAHVDMIMPHLINDAVSSGMADLGLAMMPTEDRNLVSVRDFSCGLVCIMPAGHRLARKKTIRAGDLKGERLIAISQAPPFGHLLEHVYGDRLADVHVDLEVTSGPAACWFAQAGTGIAVLDAVTVAGETFAGVVARPFVPSPRIPVQIIRNAYRPLSRPAQAFCEAFERLWQGHVMTGQRHR